MKVLRHVGFFVASLSCHAEQARDRMNNIKTRAVCVFVNMGVIQPPNLAAFDWCGLWYRRTVAGGALPFAFIGATESHQLLIHIGTEDH